VNRLFSLALGIFGILLFSVSFIQKDIAFADTTETVTAPFVNGPSGVTTTNSYSGNVSITISGTGQAAGTQFSDAFYIFTDSVGNPVLPVHSSDYHFGLCINNQPLGNYYSQVPSYDNSHTYQFPITLATSQKLTFGICDTFTSDNSGSFSITVNGATPSLESQAVNLAKTVIGAPYLGDGFTFGGKGWDWISKSDVNPDQIINNGYNFWNNAKSPNAGIDFAAGVDCSGLIYWSYNRAFNGSNTNAYLTLNNPIGYDGTDGQYRYNSKPINKSDLQPGDLLFFSYNNGQNMHHIAMYVGGDDIVEASGLKIGNTIIGVILAKLSEAITRPDFFSYARRTAPIIAGQIRAHSPISLAVTDPDGYRIDNQTVILTDQERLREVPRQLYYSEWNIDQNGRAEDMVTFPTLKTGNYFIKVVPKPGTLPTDVYGLDIIVNGQTITLANNTLIHDIPSQGYGITSTGQSISVFIPVQIDIKPGDSQNSINTGNQGKIPVAILSSNIFDAPNTVDKTSLTFGHTGNENSLAFCSTQDVNGDGLPDVICQFNTQQAGFQVGDTKGILNGKTTNGVSLNGSDAVSIVH